MSNELVSRKEVLDELANGKWVESKKAQKALGLRKQSKEKMFGRPNRL